MGKDKAKRFSENLTFRNMIQPQFEDIFHKDHPLKGHWGRDFFCNDNPIVLELAAAAANIQYLSHDAIPN